MKTFAASSFSISSFLLPHRVFKTVICTFLNQYNYTIDPSIDTYWGLDDVKLAPQSASPLDVIIRTEKKVDFLKRSVTFNVRIVLNQLCGHSLGLYAKGFNV